MTLVMCGSSVFDGDPWPQAVLMLDKLQAKIKAHFALAHPKQMRKSRDTVGEWQNRRGTAGFL